MNGDLTKYSPRHQLTCFGNKQNNTVWFTVLIIIDIINDNQQNLLIRDNNEKNKHY